jgi:hypothetical protein
VYFNALGNNTDKDIKNVNINSEGYNDAEVVNIDVIIDE